MVSYLLFHMFTYAKVNFNLPFLFTRAVILCAIIGLTLFVYWDVQNPAGFSAFSTSTGSTIFCNKDSNNPGNQWVVGGNDTSTINRIDFLPDSSCAIVVVTKAYVGSVLKTTIESKGYNSCDLSNPRRVERAVRATY